MSALLRLLRVQGVGSIISIGEGLGKSGGPRVEGRSVVPGGLHAPGAEDVAVCEVPQLRSGICPEG